MGDLKWMTASDLHIPYHNKRYLSMWFDVIRWWKPDVVDILGDLDDACPVSKYSAGLPIETEEKVVTYAPLIQDFFKDLRAIVPKAEIHFATGNHEARYDAYTDRNAPAYAGLITPELLWHTDKHGIELSYYSAPPVKRYGGFYVHHGPYAIKGGGNSAMKVVDEYHVSTIVGHTHCQAMVSKTFELRDEILTGIELGNLVDLDSPGMQYARLRDWQPGFAVLHVDGETAHPQMVPIVDNSCWVDGKRFTC